MAKGVRTPTEVPITFKDIRFIGVVFLFAFFISPALESF